MLLCVLKLATLTSQSSVIFTVAMDPGVDIPSWSKFSHHLMLIHVMPNLKAYDVQPYFIDRAVYISVSVHSKHHQ